MPPRSPDMLSVVASSHSSLHCDSPARALKASSMKLLKLRKPDSSCLKSTQSSTKNKSSLPLDREETPSVHSAALLGRVYALDILLKAGADVNSVDAVKRTPMHLAAAHGHVAIMKVLVDAQACCTSGDRDGNTPLHLAALNGQLQAVQFLLENGARIETMNTECQTPIYAALCSGKMNILVTLLDALAKERAQGKELCGMRKRDLVHGLSLAVAKSLPKAAMLLARNGADPNQVIFDSENSDYDGKTIVEILTSSGQSTFADALVQQYAQFKTTVRSQEHLARIYMNNANDSVDEI